MNYLKIHDILELTNTDHTEFNTYILRKFKFSNKMKYCQDPRIYK